MRASGLLHVLATLLFGASILSGQTFADHAAAIAGASAGVAGATALRDPLSRILQSASDASGTAAAEAPKPDKKPARSAAPQTAGTPASVHPLAAPSVLTPSPSARPDWRRGGDSRQVLAGGQASFSAYESSAPATLVTSAQLRAVASGANRSEVIGSLGIPAAQITMDDHGHLVEILQYNANGSRVGSVRCSDGRVESVNTADR
jgi:hypothetical protein